MFWNFKKYFKSVQKNSLKKIPFKIFLKKTFFGANIKRTWKAITLLTKSNFLLKILQKIFWSYKFCNQSKKVSIKTKISNKHFIQKKMHSIIIKNAVCNDVWCV